jgi:hypothetical protein
MDFDTWKREMDAKVAALDAAIEAMRVLRDSYALASWPGGLRDGASPAALRRMANSPWDDKSGY